LLKLKDFYPHQLSGGRKRLLMFAMVLVRESKILLLDESFYNIDDAHRESLEFFIKFSLSNSNTTLVMATHDKKILL